MLLEEGKGKEAQAKQEDSVPTLNLYSLTRNKGLLFHQSQQNPNGPTNAFAAFTVEPQHNLGLWKKTEEWPVDYLSLRDPFLLR